MMELAQLKFITGQALAKARHELKRDCNFNPFAQIIHDDGEIANLPLVGEWMASGTMKKAVFGMLGEICRKTEAEALIIVTDGWALEYTPEQLKRQEDPAHREQFTAISVKEGLPAAAAAGYGRLVETIVCQAQTRTSIYGLMQYYDRLTKDGVISGSQVVDQPAPPHRIRFRGEPHILSSESGATRVEGRLFSFFEGGGNNEVPPKVAEMIEKLFRFSRERARRA